MITYKQGDILKGTDDIIVQQVNCHAKMGAGLAKQIRDKYQNVYPSYSDYCFLYEDKKEKLLGQVIFVKTYDNKKIANAFGQLGYGRGKVQTDYKALESCLWKIKSHAIKGGLSVSIPENLGCGLAGGNWSVVLEIIEAVFNDYPVTIYQYKG